MQPNKRSAPATDSRKSCVSHRFSAAGWLGLTILVLVTACKREATVRVVPERPAAEPAPKNLVVGSDGLQPAPQPLAPASENSSGLFADVTNTSKIKFSYSNGRSAGEFAIVESLGGGLGVFDYDADGRLDVMFAGGGKLDNKTVTSQPCGLFRNLGQMRFRNETAAARAAGEAFFTHGIYPADFDGDGFQDVAISGYGGVQLLHNQGDGTFVTLDPLKTELQPDWSSSLAWADLDMNGFVDLYVAHYVDWSWDKHPICPGQGDVVREVCAPREFAGMRDVVYSNDGQWPFRPESESIGLQADGKGLGVAVADVNADGYPDIYVANDTTDNFFYVNDGQGKFTNAAVMAGVSGDDAGVSTGSMGVCILDANADQRPDIFVTNFERELSALYRNEGEGFFTFASRQAGFAAYEAGFVGFGTVAVDIDFDGDQDIVVSNGHVSYASPYAAYRQQPLVFENGEGNQFRRLQLPGYFAVSHTGRGLASGDLNNDGVVDLVVSHLEEPVAVIEATSQPECNWGILTLVGTLSNRDAIGSKISLHANGKVSTQFVVGGGSYLSTSDRRLHVYWSGDDATIGVTWPSGANEQFSVQPSGETVIVEGRGEALLPLK